MRPVVHLIFAAQRPDVNVMPMQLRDNLGNRLILRVASIGTSEIALGVKGQNRFWAWAISRRGSTARMESSSPKHPFSRTKTSFGP